MITEIDIDTPVRVAYDQWTQFEDFPLFMDHVEKVEQLDDAHVHWTARIAGVSREWDAEITEQTPDQRIAWTSTDGTSHAGVVTFHPLDDDHTRVVLQLEMHPEGFLEQVADKGGFVSDRAKKDLADFKDFIEQRGRATGGWRERIEREPDQGHQRAVDELMAEPKDELARRASDADIDGWSSMTKRDLAEALLAERAAR